jgi:hypothetical protein
MKPGWKTTEFWTTLIAQLLALLAFLGVLTPNDSQTLGEALTKSVAAVCTLLANGAVVIHYIKSRLTLKLNGSSQPPRSAVLPLVLVALLLPQAALAETQATALLPWRAKIEQQLQELQRRQTPPAPIIIQPPQVLPIPGEPRQQLPVPGEPRQPLPIPGQPQQPLPIPGDPRQALPVPGAPQQPLPFMPPATGGPQSYTVRRALAWPID